MRKLSEGFMQALDSGFLKGIPRAVIADKDLDLYIRENYLNIYYKGNSLLKLEEWGGDRYQVEINQKFLEGLSFVELNDEKSTADFLRKIPLLKDNIIRFGSSSIEIEYEQLIIRANNSELRNNSEIFFVDRQYVLGSYRIDLMGFLWSRAQRRKGQTVKPCLMEVKFALNTDIKQVHDQLSQYYELIVEKAAEISDELKSSFQQRLALNLYDQAPSRLDAMKTLFFARDIEDYQFILILVDYNPHSSLLDIPSLASLPFAHQIRILQTGFAIWDRNLIPVSELSG